jgi:hypothetical protein
MSLQKKKVKPMKAVKEEIAIKLLNKQPKNKTRVNLDFSYEPQDKKALRKYISRCTQPPNQHK